MTSRNLQKVEAVPGNDVLNPGLFPGEGSQDGAFVISGVRRLWKDAKAFLNRQIKLIQPPIQSSCQAIRIASFSRTEILPLGKRINIRAILMLSLQAVCESPK